MNENLSGYYKSLLESEEDEFIRDCKVLDITPFIVYILNMIEQAIVSSIASQNILNDMESRRITKMKKHKDSEITFKNCKRIMNLDDEAVLKLLSGLVLKGYIEEVHGEYSYYRLIV